MEESRARALSDRLRDLSRPFHVVGLGSFGGNIELVRFLTGLGGSVVLHEAKTHADLEDSWEALGAARERVEARWSEALPELPAGDLAFLSPAVPPQHVCLKGRNDALISTEIEIALLLLAERGSTAHVVTGSVGKSTTASLLARALGVEVFGNIGRSVLELHPNLPGELVLELSSFQLHYLRPLRFTPSSWLLTLVDGHHGDWHGGEEAYRRAKLDWIEAWSPDVPGVSMAEPATHGRVRFDGKNLSVAGLLEPSDLERRFKLIGGHNRLNLTTALRLVDRLDILDAASLERALSFSGLPHRLECVATPHGCRFVNDSKATAPAAVLPALEAMRHGGVLILQGVDKQQDFTAIFARAKEQRLRVYALGQLGARFARERPRQLTGHFSTLDDLFAAVDFAGFRDTDVFFSPGAPSYDGYRNYEQRGDHFKALARALLS